MAAWYPPGMKKRVQSNVAGCFQLKKKCSKLENWVPGYLFEASQQLCCVHGTVHGHYPEAVARQQGYQSHQAGLPTGRGPNQYCHPAFLHTFHQGFQGPQCLMCDGQRGIQGHRGSAAALQDRKAHLWGQSIEEEILNFVQTIQNICCWEIYLSGIFFYQPAGWVE